ncbi:MAG: uroporphyrinogen decarboxylase [Rhodanobacter denitrificans]|uniref:Uroporphyrinogen decarboxylase n=1 Tax=Rhodanobacter denitrificans TaxID=666685 RepID=A0A2W5K2P7_9GAMM|nr:MAG: uroporphyrinogen decarboxylase [Rhodanobacter denitrificans]
MTLKNDRLLRALRRQPVDRTPVWIMRQAGRYLPEYRATRARAGSFLALAKTPELACEVTLQPLDRFPLDAAILFSDILTIPDAMGLGLHFVEGEGPKFHHPLRDAAAIARLGVPDPERDLRYVTDAVRLIRRELDGRVPLIGFSGSPWTLACYMIQGEGSSDFAHAKALLWNDPASLHRLLDVNARAVAAYLAAQAAAGAQALMLFDTWGGLLGPGPFLEFSLRYIAQVVDALDADPVARELPLIVFSKGANGHLEALAGTGCAALGVDWTITLGEARARVGDRVALQGNLDPSVLYARPESIRAEAHATLASFGAGPGLVFNLGHGITPQVDPAHLGVLIDAVHAWRPAER